MLGGCSCHHGCWSCEREKENQILPPFWVAFVFSINYKGEFAWVCSFWRYVSYLFLGKLVDFWFFIFFSQFCRIRLWRYFLGFTSYSGFSSISKNWLCLNVVLHLRQRYQLGDEYGLFFFFKRMEIIGINYLYTIN